MESIYKTSYVEDARHLFRTFPDGEPLVNEKAGLIDISSIKQILVMRNQFFYITDVTDFSNVFVNRNLTKVLGYHPNDFLDLGFVYHAIHPDDAEFVFAFSKKTIAWAYTVTDILRCDPFAAVFSIDFRMRHKLGHYIRVNRQTSCYRTDAEGNMVYAISHFTDISHIKKSNMVTYSWKTTVDLEFSIADLVEQFQQNILTPREMEIIRYLSQGFSATQIGKMLFISEHTVIAHRKHILRKTKAKNSAELIKYAIETGLI